MLRKPLLPVAALVAAAGLAGCYPVVSNESSSQKDLIGDVSLTADACEASFASLVIAELFSVIDDDLELRKAASRALPSGPESLFTCTERDDVLDVLDGSEGYEAALALSVPRQVLVGYRVPDGVKPPASFTATVEVGRAGEPLVYRDGLTARGVSMDEPIVEQQTVTFRRATELDAQIPAHYDWLLGLPMLGGDDELETPPLLGAGEKAVGYVSDQIDGSILGGYQLNAAFGLPDGAAPAGSFNALTMLGSRFAFDDDDIVLPDRRRAEVENPFRADRPVECLDFSAIAEEPESEDDVFSLAAKAICPSPNWLAGFELNARAEVTDPNDELVAAIKTAIKGIEVEVRDARVVGGEGFAEQGGTATVPFVLRTSGQASAATLAQTASTTLPGATAAPNAPSTTFPAGGDAARPVTVTVPAGAAPGTYAVTLTVQVGGQTRTGIGRVVVLPKQQQAPATPNAAPSRDRDNLYMDASGTIAFGWVCPPACGNNTVDVLAPKAGISPKANTAAAGKPRLLRIARGRFSAKTGKRTRVKVKLFKRAQRAVRGGRTVTAIVVVRDSKGKPEVRRVVIRRKTT